MLVGASKTCIIIIIMHKSLPLHGLKSTPTSLEIPHRKRKDGIQDHSGSPASQAGYLKWYVLQMFVF